MNQHLAKYHQRAPRYILQPLDNNYIRVAGPQQTPWEENTEIKNISLSGLAFTAPVDLCPTMGEFIKLQFEIPGGEQIACHAMVTRIEPYDNSSCLIGIQFYRLQSATKIALLQGLAKNLKQQMQAKQEQLSKRNYLWTQMKKHRKKSLLMVLLLIVWSYLTIVSH